MASGNTSTTMVCPANDPLRISRAAPASAVARAVAKVAVFPVAASRRLDAPTGSEAEYRAVEIATDEDDSEPVLLWTQVMGSLPDSVSTRPVKWISRR